MSPRVWSLKSVNNFLTSSYSSFGNVLFFQTRIKILFLKKSPSFGVSLKNLNLLSPDKE